MRVDTARSITTHRNKNWELQNRVMDIHGPDRNPYYLPLIQLSIVLTVDNLDRALVTVYRQSVLASGRFLLLFSLSLLNLTFFPFSPASRSVLVPKTLTLRKPSMQ